MDLCSVGTRMDRQTARDEGGCHLRLGVGTHDLGRTIMYEDAYRRPVLVHPDMEDGVLVLEFAIRVTQLGNAKAKPLWAHPAGKG